MPLPQALADLVNEIQDVPANQRLEFIVELGEELPALPARYAEHPELLEAVPECQSPIFLTTEVEDGLVHLFFSAPTEAVTTRGLAAVLNEGLNQQPVDDVLSVPEDFALQLPLEGSVSSLRLYGLTGMLMRIQRQVRRESA